MILHLAGLDWDCPSPSFYRLVLPSPHVAAIDISYLGQRGEWCLFLERNGHVSTQCFENRDQAIGMVREAFNREGL